MFFDFIFSSSSYTIPNKINKQKRMKWKKEEEDFIMGFSSYLIAFGVFRFICFLHSNIRWKQFRFLSQYKNQTNIYVKKIIYSQRHAHKCTRTQHIHSHFRYIGEWTMHHFEIEFLCFSELAPPEKNCVIKLMAPFQFQTIFTEMFIRKTLFNAFILKPNVGPIVYFIQNYYIVCSVMLLISYFISIDRMLCTGFCCFYLIVLHYGR